MVVPAALRDLPTARDFLYSPFEHSVETHSGAMMKQGDLVTTLV